MDSDPSAFLRKCMYLDCYPAHIRDACSQLSSVSQIRDASLHVRMRCNGCIYPNHIISSSYYTFWSAVADLQGRRPSGAQAPEGEACNSTTKGVIISLLIVARWYDVTKH